MNPFDSLAVKELRRQPGRFMVATVVLSFLSLLLLFLGGLLDGLYLGSTGAIRAQDADVIVYSQDARDSFLRSRITAEQRTIVEGAPGVEAVGGLGFALFGAGVPDQDEIADVAVIGYELPPNGVPAPPADGEAFADDSLKSDGVRLGQTLAVGPAGTSITVIGFVSDTNYLQQGALWTTLDTWRQVQRDNRPDAAVADDVVQVLAVQGEGDLVTSIDAATDGATSTLTKDDAVLALPGIEAQNGTFNQIIYTTLVIVLAVVGLFFSLLTLERIGLYGVLKAIGASSRRLFAGVTLQAIVVTLIGFAIGGAAALLISVVVDGAIPLQLTRGRFVFTFVALLVAAVLGSLISLRRVVRIDPASAIGSPQ
jgi:putative ABC transport system permease protein